MRLTRFSSSRTFPGQSYSAEQTERVVRRLELRLVVVLRVVRQEELHERRDLVAPLSQRRQRDADDVQPEEEVLAEEPVAHRLLEVAVRRRHDPHVDADIITAAEPRELAVLQDLQQLRLQRRPASR